MNSTKLKIRLYGDPCLRKKSSPVKEVGPSERMLIGSMIETMHERKGLGLAAPQVGIHQRIFVADIGEGPTAFINPKIVRRAGSAVWEEGCLSIPDITIEIKRAQKVLVRYLDENNHRHERSFTELMARVILHEIDHLNGKLIVDYAGLKKKREIKPKLKEIEKLTREQT